MTRAVFSLQPDGGGSSASGVIQALRGLDLEEIEEKGEGAPSNSASERPDKASLDLQDKSRRESRDELLGGMFLDEEPPMSLSMRRAMEIQLPSVQQAESVDILFASPSGHKGNEHTHFPDPFKEGALRGESGAIGATPAPGAGEAAQKPPAEGFATPLSGVGGGETASVAPIGAKEAVRIEEGSSQGSLRDVAGSTSGRATPQFAHGAGSSTSSMKSLVARRRFPT